MLPTTASGKLSKTIITRGTAAELNPAKQENRQSYRGLCSTLHRMCVLTKLLSLLLLCAALWCAWKDPQVELLVRSALEADLYVLCFLDFCRKQLELFASNNLVT